MTDKVNYVNLLEKNDNNMLLRKWIRFPQQLHFFVCFCREHQSTALVAGNMPELIFPQHSYRLFFGLDVGIKRDAFNSFGRKLYTNQFFFFFFIFPPKNQQKCVFFPLHYLGKLVSLNSPLMLL